MKLKSVIAILFVFIIQASYSQKNKSNAATDQLTIRLDKVAFDESSLLRVIASNNETVAFYNRFENPSGPVKSMRVFDSNENLICTLVPLITEKGFEIHIRDSNQSRGLVDLTAQINGVKINYDSKVDYFGKPYDYISSNKVGIGKVSIEEAVHYQGQEVISNHKSVSSFSGIQNSPIMVNRAFYEENKVDAANWVLIIELLRELSLESSKYNNSSNIGQ